MRRDAGGAETDEPTIDVTLDAAMEITTDPLMGASDDQPTAVAPVAKVRSLANASALLPGAGSEKPSVDPVPGAGPLAAPMMTMRGEGSMPPDQRSGEPSMDHTSEFEPEARVPTQPAMRVPALATSAFSRPAPIARPPPAVRQSPRPAAAMASAQLSSTQLSSAQPSSAAASPAASVVPAHEEVDEDALEAPTRVDPSSKLMLPDGVPSRIGRYELCSELAAGGMGSVYLARVRGPGGFHKLVALKTVHPHLARETEFMQMFLDEARIAALINHPNVCSVFDFGAAEGRYFLAMEFLVGEPLTVVLQEAVRQRALDDPRHTARAARIVAEVAEGLHAAHELCDGEDRELGVVHRDVAPHNLFITYDGSVRVVDFGIARAVDRLSNTTTGTFKGRFAYMAPEYLREEPVDRRADIWSLGVVLWELLVGKRLFRRDTQAQTMMAVLNAPIDPPSSQRAGIPTELDRIVLRAMARNAADRYQSARELAKDLTRFISQQSDPCGTMEIAEWMERLLPVELAQKRMLVAAARKPSSDESFIQHAGVAKAIAAGPEGSRVVRVGDRSRTQRRILYAAAIVALVLGAAIIGAIAGRSSVGEQVEMASASTPRPPASHGSTAATPASEAAARTVTAARTGTAAPAYAAESPNAGAADSLAPAVSATGAAGVATADDADDENPVTGAVAERAAATTAGSSPATARAPSSETPRRASAPSRPSTAGSTSAPSGRPAQPRPTAEPGSLNVVTPGGWAEVWLRGRKLGQSPGRFALPAGTHTLEVRPFGRGPGQRVRVVVRSGATERLSVPIGE